MLMGWIWLGLPHHHFTERPGAVSTTFIRRSMMVNMKDADDTKLPEGPDDPPEGFFSWLEYEEWNRTPSEDYVPMWMLLE